MSWFPSRLFGWLLARPNLVCDPEVWAAGVHELERRTLNGSRESGAFLLGKDVDSRKYILEFAFYDDIDPHALDTGIVKFAGHCFPKLWALCRKRGYSVVADVHLHPAGYGQSPSDQENPVIPRAGHIAIIIPHFGRRATEPGGIGIYEYLGNNRWADRTKKGSRFFAVTAGRT